MRVETGALQIDKDWAGLFVRGDDSLFLSVVLQTVLEEKELGYFEKHFLQQLMFVIDVDVNHNSEHRNPQKLNAELLWKDRYEEDE